MQAVSKMDISALCTSAGLLHYVPAQISQPDSVVSLLDAPEAIDIRTAIDLQGPLCLAESGRNADWFDSRGEAAAGGTFPGAAPDCLQSRGTQVFNWSFSIQGRLL